MNSEKKNIVFFGTLDLEERAEVGSCKQQVLRPFLHSCMSDDDERIELPV